MTDATKAQSGKRLLLRWAACVCVAAPLAAQAPDLAPLHWTAPAYTEAGRRAHIEGETKAALTIDAQGRVSEAHLIQDLPMGLGQAALGALRQWTFSAASEAERHTTITVRYVIEPPGEWESGAALETPDVLRVWVVTPERRIERALEHCTPLDPHAPDALEALAVALAERVRLTRTPRVALSIAGRPPTREEIERFRDLPARFFRSWWRAHLTYAEDIDLSLICRGPTGALILELVTSARPAPYRDRYWVENRAGRWVVVSTAQQTRSVF